MRRALPLALAERRIIACFLLGVASQQMYDYRAGAAPWRHGVKRE